MSRWSEYYSNSDFCGFWAERAKDEGLQVLVIFALGFDPRSLTALRCLAKLGLRDRLGYLALRLKTSAVFAQSGSVAEGLVEDNVTALNGLHVKRVEGILDVDTHDEEGHNVVGRQALRAVANGIALSLGKYTDVVVDISGMPRGAFYPLISYLIRQSDKGKFPNLHVAVVEDPLLDSQISGIEYGKADYLQTFRKQGTEKVIWLPLIGDNEVARLEKIHNEIGSSCIEICPIFPFPASSLRHADDLLLQHAELLFDGLLVSRDNILLCDEQNPFDVYRKIIDVHEYYQGRLSGALALGEVTTVVSPLASKMLSLGMLLAAIEKTLPVCHVEAGVYRVDKQNESALREGSSGVPAEIWLTGEPYVP